MGRSAEGSDNPALAAQRRGWESSGISTPLSRSIQVLRGVCPGLDPGAGLASQKPAVSGAQELCQEPCAPTMCFGVSNMNCGGQALVRMEFPASGESPSSKAYIPPLPVFILGKETLPDQGGISFSQ